MNNKPLPITQHIRYGLTLLSFGTLLPSIATLYMLKPLSEISRSALNLRRRVRYEIK